MSLEFLSEVKRKRFLESFKNAGLFKTEAEMSICNKEIAKKFYVSQRTIKFHFTNIFKKLKIFNRSQIIWRVYPLNK